MSHLRLAMEPIPAGSRLASLAKLLPRQQWDMLRRAVYKQAGYRCQICGGEGRLHCHEVWAYSPDTAVQWLRGFQALCQLCHDTKHICFTRDSSRLESLLQHFMTVNHLQRQEAEGFLRGAQERQRWLDQRQWRIDYGSWNSRMPALKDVDHRRRYVQSPRPSYRRY